MDNNLFSSLQSAIKNWWVSLLVGIVSLAVGIWCFATPLSTFVALTIIFMIAFFVGGISEIIFAISNKAVLKNWGWSLAIGIIDLIFAIILLTNPVLAPIVFSYLIAFWVFFRAIWGISMALDLKQYKDRNWGSLLFLSIVGVILALILLIQPMIAGLMAAYVIALSFIFYGIFRIYLAFRLKSLHKNLPKE